MKNKTKKKFILPKIKTNATLVVVYAKGIYVTFLFYRSEKNYDSTKKNSAYLNLFFGGLFFMFASFKSLHTISEF